MDCHGIIYIWKSKYARATQAFLTGYYYGAKYCCRPENTEKTDLVLTPLPSSTTVNSSGFSTWADTVTKYIAQNLSQDMFTTMESIIRPDKKHVAYGDLYPSLNFIECATVTA